MLPRVAIIYVCYGNKRHLPEVADSWAGQTYPKDRTGIVIIPNGSPDGVTKDVKQDVLPRAGKDLPEAVHLIDDGVNRGFAGGYNAGMRWAMEQGYDYVFLNNGDLKLAPKTIEEVVKVAERDENIAAVQSLVLFWHDRQKVNVTGGVIHVAGYGYARDNGRRIDEVSLQNPEEIMYASGAAVLYRCSVLEHVGLLEEGFFMYHEDLELGLRMRIAGYTNVVATESRVYHDYEFSRNPKKFQWMETYRWIVLLAYLKLPSLILMSPLLLAIEVGSWISALAGGWIGAKIRACLAFFTPHSWRLLIQMRKRQKALRVIQDRDWLERVVGVIEDQEQVSVFVHFANAVIDPLWRFIRKGIRW